MPQKIFQAKPINPSPFARCRVDIIIPFHGQYDKTANLVNGIINHAKSNPYRITLVDDCSPNNHFTRSMEMINQDLVRVIRSDTQMGFGGALRLGYENTQQPWIMFMHSDVLIQHPHWMISMGESLLRLKSHGVRLISAKTNNPVNGDPRLKSEHIDVNAQDIILSDTFVPLHCAMCHRDLFRHIGGFIKEYPYGFYEDEELAYRMRKYGFKQAISGQAWVYHIGGATFTSLYNSNPDIREVTENNYDLCIHDLRQLQIKK